MGVDQWVGACPLLFEVEGMLCFVSPTFFGVRHFYTNAHGIHWMTGAIFVKFSQSILMKIIIGSKLRAYIAFTLGASGGFFGCIFAKPERIWMRPVI